MILGKLKDISRYYHIHPNLDKAIDFLIKEDLESYEPGSYAIDGKEVFMNRFNYETIPEEDGFFEGHRDYLDIHILVDGSEKLGYEDESALTVEIPYNEAEDFIKYKGEAALWYHMIPGCFAIVFPEDIHMPKIQDKKAEKVRKAVLKVKVR